MKTHFALLITLIGMTIPSEGATTEWLRITLTAPFEGGSWPAPILLQRVDSLNERIVSDAQFSKQLAAPKGSSKYEYLLPSVRPGKYVVRLAPTYFQEIDPPNT